MLAPSRAPDADVYAEVAALKRTHVFRTELTYLDVNDTTIPLIKYSRGPTVSSRAGLMGEKKV